MGCKLRTYWSIRWREIIGQNALTIFSWVIFFPPYQIKGNDCFNALCWLLYFSKEKPYTSVCAAVSPSVLLYYRLYISAIETGSECWPLGQIDGPRSVCSERLQNHQGANVTSGQRTPTCKIPDPSSTALLVDHWYGFSWLQSPAPQ